MVTVPPLPCLIIIVCEPEVAFSMICTLFMVLGPIVIVHAESSVPVYLIYIALAWSVEPSAIVEV